MKLGVYRLGASEWLSSRLHPKRDERVMKNVKRNAGTVTTACGHPVFIHPTCDIFARFTHSVYK